MATKEDFIDAMGGASEPLGDPLAFTGVPGDTITLTSHGLTAGTGPVRLSGGEGDEFPGGLAPLTNYWVGVVSANAVQLYASPAAFAAGSPINITSAGDGDFDVDSEAVSEDFGSTDVDATENTITIAAHGFITGQGPMTFDTDGGGSPVLPAGLSDSVNYWIIRVSADVFSVATSVANALAGTAVDITDTGTQDGGDFLIEQAAVEDDFDEEDVRVADGQLTVTAHGKQTGAGPFMVANQGGALPVGLSNVGKYWVINIGVNTVGLASSRDNALAGISVPLLTAGTGTNTIFATMESLADSLELVLDQVLTFPGNLSNDKVVNDRKFWEAAVFGTGFLSA